jgi:hypothetical protein
MKVLKFLIPIAGILLISAFYSCSKSSPKPTSPVLPPANLVAHWELNGNANDASRYGNNGAAIGTTAVADRFGNAGSALHFDGFSSYVVIPDSIRLRLINTDFTINAWIELDAYSYENVSAIMSKRISGSNNGWLFAVNGQGNTPTYTLGSVYYGPGGGNADAISSKAVSIGSWHMITCVYTYAAQTLSIYIDGVLDHTVNSILSPNASISAPLYIGEDTDGTPTGQYFFKGSMDDIRIYNTALDLSSIQQLRSATN